MTTEAEEGVYVVAWMRNGREFLLDVDSRDMAITSAEKITEDGALHVRLMGPVDVPVDAATSTRIWERVQRRRNAEAELSILLTEAGL